MPYVVRSKIFVYSFFSYWCRRAAAL